MSTRDRVSAVTTMTLFYHPRQRGVPGQDITVLLGWNPADPYAIRLGFTGGREWLMDRELLAAGLRGPAGYGDLRLSPLGETRVDITLISHWSDQPTVTLRVSRQALQSFLDRVWSLRPDTIDVTDALDKWLRELPVT